MFSFHFVRLRCSTAFSNSTMLPFMAFRSTMVGESASFIVEWNAVMVRAKGPSLARFAEVDRIRRQGVIGRSQASQDAGKRAGSGLKGYLKSTKLPSFATTPACLCRLRELSD